MKSWNASSPPCAPTPGFWKCVGISTSAPGNGTVVWRSPARWWNSCLIPRCLGCIVLSRGAGFGAEVKRRIILGTYVLSSGYYDAYYLRAQKVRTLIRQDFLKAFEQVDAILTPVTPTAAFKIGEKVEVPLQMYRGDIFTLSCNLAGICGISVPCGFISSPKLPIGLQLLGKPFGEETIMRIAHAYEQSTPSHKERPPLGA